MTAISMSGGLGDVFVVESHFPSDLSLDLIYWKHQRHAPLVELFDLAYPGLTHEHLYLPHWTGRILKIDRKCQYGNERQFPKIVDGRLPFRGSMILDTIPPIRLIDQPYIVIIPDTPADRRPPYRILDHQDWSSLLDWLESFDVRGVVLNRGSLVPIPSHPLILDLRDRTTLAESIGILKGANGYAGIDTSLTVLACQVFDAEHLAIKGPRDYYRRWIACYCAPHRAFPFVGDSLADPISSMCLTASPTSASSSINTTILSPSTDRPTRISMPVLDGVQSV